MEKSLTFDALPQAVDALSNDVQELKMLVSKLLIPSGNEAEKILTVSQAADLLSLAVPSVYGLVHRSLIPFMKKGKRLYFSEQDLRNWLKSGRRQTIQEMKDDAAESIYNGKSERGKR